MLDGQLDEPLKPKSDSAEAMDLLKLQKLGGSYTPADFACTKIGSVEEHGIDLAQLGKLELKSQVMLLLEQMEQV